MSKPSNAACFLDKGSKRNNRHQHVLFSFRNTIYIYSKRVELLLSYVECMYVRARSSSSDEVVDKASRGAARLSYEF